MEKAPGLILGSDRASCWPQKDAVEEHLLAPLWQHVLRDGKWVCLALWQVLGLHRQWPTPSPQHAQTLVREDNKMGSHSFSWWVLDGSKFWVPRSTRGRLFYEEGIGKHILGKARAELCFRSEVRVAQRWEGRANVLQVEKQLMSGFEGMHNRMGTT